MKNIILTTLNSRFSHSSLGLRYLYANLRELKPQAEILEFVINSSVQTIAEQILEKKLFSYLIVIISCCNTFKKSEKEKNPTLVGFLLTYLFQTIVTV